MDAPAPHELFVSSAERAPLSGRGFWPTPLRPDFIIRPAVLDLLPGSVEIAAGGVQRLPGPPISQDAYLRCCCCALHRSELRIENPGDLVAGAFQMHVRGAVRGAGESGGGGGVPCGRGPLSGCWAVGGRGVGARGAVGGVPPPLGGARKTPAPPAALA